MRLGHCEYQARQSITTKGSAIFYPVHFADNAFGGYALGGGTEKFLFGLNSAAATQGGFLSGITPQDEDCSSRFAQKCNQRHLTPLGAHLITSMMNKGMIIDIDHMGMHTTDEVLALTTARHYPVISGHTGFVGTAMPGHSSERDKSDAWLATMKTGWGDGFGRRHSGAGADLYAELARCGAQRLRWDDENVRSGLSLRGR